MLPLDRLLRSSQIQDVALVFDSGFVAHYPLYSFKAFDSFSDMAVGNWPTPNGITGVVKISVEDIILVRVDRV